jgi:hypothetical protein
MLKLELLPFLFDCNLEFGKISLASFELCCGRLDFRSQTLNSLLQILELAFPCPKAGSFVSDLDTLAF